MDDLYRAANIVGPGIVQSV